jgi:hypothetical protein
MDKKSISNWIRQSRYRAKKQNIPCDISVEAVMEIIEYYNGKCAYCEAAANSLDHPFPLKDGPPNITANVLPICNKCKKLKKVNSLIWLYNNGHLTEKNYVKIIKDMISNDQSGSMKQYVKKMSGL